MDDAVDEIVPEAEWRGGLSEEARGRAALALALWRTDLDACYGTATPVTSQGTGLKPFVGEFGLPRDAFERLIDGVEMDLDHSRYPTFAALEEYCRHVASTVGLICVEIFGYRDPRARDYAVNLGIALQLTNIIRDVAVDLTRGRVYLPLEDLARFDCSEADLATSAPSPAVRWLLEFECRRAHEFYDRAAESLPASDARSLVAAEIMGGIYYGILRRIERADYDVFKKRIRVPRPQRALIAARIWLQTLLLKP